MLSLKTKIAYGVGDMAGSLDATVYGFFYNAFLLEIAQVDPFYAGLTIMAARIFDAINDPIIGILSDNTKSRWGRRRPWLLFGAPCLALSFFLLWTVPHQRSKAGKAAYYFVVQILHSLAFTCVNLPYCAMTPDLAVKYDDRTALTMFRFVFSLTGSAVSAVGQSLINEKFGTGRGLLMGGAFWAIIMWLATWTTVFGTGGKNNSNNNNNSLTPHTGHNGDVMIDEIAVDDDDDQGVENGDRRLGSKRTRRLSDPNAPTYGSVPLPSSPSIRQQNMDDNNNDNNDYDGDDDEINNRSSNNNDNLNNNYPIGRLVSNNSNNNDGWFISALKDVVSGLRQLVANKAFLLVTTIYALAWIALQLVQSNLILFAKYVVKAGTDQVRLVFVGLMIMVLISLLVFNQISQRFDKKVAYYIGMSVWAVSQFCLTFVQEGQLPLLYVLGALAGVGVAVASLVIWAMLPDVIDLDELKTGNRREGLYYSSFVFLQKLGVAVGLAVGNFAIGAAGFVAPPSQDDYLEQNNKVKLTLRFLMGPVPAFLLLLSFVAVHYYPITRRSHEETIANLAAKRRDMRNEEEGQQMGLLS